MSADSWEICPRCLRAVRYASETGDVDPEDICPRCLRAGDVDPEAGALLSDWAFKYGDEK